ncbi:hypothetical protein Cgig2_009555 [Carnegiea gigantea]|uniref:Uncharacterized protein n=1 Tax=Carnegiea gigantea TaxID=171969 RepID=A0A9Q1KBA1_9CARY|nr:hypothetical protein Cgig2_009555 [Carnegiea gigantea]
MRLTTLAICTGQFLQPPARFNPPLLPPNATTVVPPPPSPSLSYSDCPPTHSSQSQSQSQSQSSEWVTRPTSPRFITRASVTNVPENIGEILAMSPYLGLPVNQLCSRICGIKTSWEFASTLKEYEDKFESAGVKVIAVGVGTPNKAHHLAERLPFHMEYLYADPECKAYDVLGLYYGFGRTFFNPASVSLSLYHFVSRKARVLSRFESLQKATKNYTIAATPDDRSGVLQQGGMFVFKGEQLLYARKDEGTGDHAPLDDVLNATVKVVVKEWNTPPKRETYNLHSCERNDPA